MRILILSFAVFSLVCSVACTPASERGTEKALGNVGSIIKTGTDKLFTTPKGNKTSAGNEEKEQDEAS